MLLEVLNRNFLIIHNLETRKPSPVTGKGWEEAGVGKGGGRGRGRGGMSDRMERLGRSPEGEGREEGPDVA